MSTTRTLQAAESPRVGGGFPYCSRLRAEGQAAGVVTAVFEGFLFCAPDGGFVAFEVFGCVFGASLADAFELQPIVVVADEVLGRAELAADAGARADAAFGEVAVRDDVPTDDEGVPLGLRDGGSDGHASEAGGCDEG